MLIPLKIIFRGIPAFDTVGEEIRRLAANLDRYSEHLHGCRVTIDSAGSHRQRGLLWAVRLDLTIAGGDIVIDRSHHHEDIDMLLNDAFEAAAKTLQTYHVRGRARAKIPRPAAHASVTKLFQ
jgi:hypothetical protein